MMGNEVPVPVIGELTFLIDRPEDFERGVVGGREAAEKGLLLLPPLADRLPIGTVYPCVCRPGQLFLHISIGLLKKTIGVSSPESLPKVLYGTLCLSFHPGSVGRAQTWIKLVVMGKAGKLDVERGFSLFSPDDHVFHVVIEHFLRDATQIGKGADVAIHEGLKSTLFYKLDVHGPGIAQDHDKGKNRTGRSVMFHDLEVSLVNLCLEARLGLKPDIGDVPLLAFNSPNDLLYRRVASGVSHAGEFLEDPCSLIIILFKVILDNLTKGIQDAFSSATLVVLRK